MNRKINRVAVVAFAAVFTLASCACSSEQREPTKEKIDSSVTSFSAEKDEYSTDRDNQSKPSVDFKAINNSWEADDAISVFMRSNATILAANKKYVTKSSGQTAKFEPETEDDLLSIPQGGKVDFFAIYPHSSLDAEGNTTIDLSDQSDPAKIDLMYSDNLKDVTQTSGLKLNFRHRLAKLNFIVTGETGLDLGKLKVSLVNFPAAATYNILTNSLSNVGAASTFEAYSAGVGTTAHFEAFVLPEVDNTSAKVLFEINGSTYTFALRNGIIFSPNASYTYNVKLEKNGSVTEPPTQDYFEMPDVSPIEGKTQVATHFVGSARNYSVYFEYDTKLALCISYPLHPSHYASGKRSDAWSFDPKIPTNFQQDLIKGSYKGSPSGTYAGYSRGHQLPSGDRVADPAMNRQTFYMTNMTPQRQDKFNGSIWAKLENQVRTWTSALSSNGMGLDTLYVATGPILETFPGADPVSNPKYQYDQKGQPIQVPVYYYKALAKQDAQGKWYTVAFLMPHRDYDENELYNDYQVPVADVEKIIGFKLFPQISPEVKAKVEPSKWN